MVTMEDDELPSAPEGYKMIGVGGEAPRHRVLARIFECTICGAAVLGTNRHTAWHGEG